VTQAGKYEVLMNYASDEGQGGRGTFDAAGRPLEFTVDSTTGWDMYTNYIAGTVTLSAGAKDLVLKAAELNGSEFIDLKKIKLRRVGDLAVAVGVDTLNTLIPDDAICEGGAVNQTVDIGGWVEGASATWPLEVAQDGNYRVTVYGAAPDGMGGIGRLSFLHTTREFEIVPTGDWGNYTNYDAGIIGLRAGVYDMKVDGAQYNGGWLMNCNKVELEYVGEFNPVTTVSGAETLLPASMCVPAGPGIQNEWFETGGWQRGGLVTWTLNVPEAGDYELFINYGSDSGCGGPGYIKIGEAQTDMNIEPTGGWSTYQELSFGTFSLPAGETTLTVEAAPEAQDWYMNLVYVRLVSANG
jgi:hypothetical protein